MLGLAPSIRIERLSGVRSRKRPLEAIRGVRQKIQQGRPPLRSHRRHCTGAYCDQRGNLKISQENQAGRMRKKNPWRRRGGRTPTYAERKDGKGRECHLSCRWESALTQGLGILSSLMIFYHVTMTLRMCARACTSDSPLYSPGCQRQRMDKLG